MTNGHIAVVGANASGKTKFISALASRTDTSIVTFKDSYGGYADTSYFMQQRWNMFTVDAEMQNVQQDLEKTARRCRNYEAAMARLRDLTDAFKLQPLMDRLPVSLSSGELRKFHLTKILLRGPGILVIDNPFIGLDPKARKELTKLLETLAAKGGQQIILVLPRPSEIPDFISKVIEVKDGVASEEIPLEQYRKENFPPEVVKFCHLTIKYGQRTVIDDLSWTVREGEHWVLTGSNGSGKSMLLSMICADNPMAYACDISLFGRARGTGESIWDIKKNIGYVSPEMHRSFASLAVPALDIVSSGLFDTEGLFRHPAEEQRAGCLEWMNRFGIADLAGRTFTQLSSGEQRLCLVARAFVKNPPLLILDEPLHGLDDACRLQVKQIMEETCSQPGKTLIMVSHYPEEYPSCIDHSLTL